MGKMIVLTFSDSEETVFKRYAGKRNVNFMRIREQTATINSGRMEITLYALFSCKGDLCICQKTMRTNRHRNAARTL